MTRRKSRGAETWPLVRDIAAFALGTFMLLWQTVWENSAQIVLVVAAVALLGVPASSAAQRWLLDRVERLRSDDEGKQR